MHCAECSGCHFRGGEEGKAEGHEEVRLGAVRLSLIDRR